MKYLSSILGLFLFPLLLVAQLQELRTLTRAGQATIDLVAGQLTQVTGDLSLDLRYGELTIGYNLPAPDEGLYYSVDLGIQLNGQPLALLPEQMKGERTPLTAGGSQQLLITGLYDRFIQLAGTLEVEIRASLMGDLGKLYGVDCSGPRPDFAGRQRAPYFVAAGVGATGIVIGQLFRVQRDDVYDNDYLKASSRAEAQPFYEDANRKHHNYLLFTYAGSAILVADAALYWLRQSRYKKDLKRWESCPGNNLSLRPVIEQPSWTKPVGQVGMTLTLTF